MSDLLQKERTSQAVQTYSSSESNLIRTTDKQKERKEITKEGMEEESETQDKITTTDKQQAKRKSKTPLLPAPTSQGNPSFVTSIVTDPEIRQSPFTTCWTTCTSSVGKSLIP